LKERLATLGLALCALALFYLLFLPKPQPSDISPAMPLSTESGLSGYQAVWRWLKAERISVVALHERYDSLNLADARFTSTGNVLLTTLPHKLPVRPNEVTRLDAWVERGNTLVVMAALDDTPLWTLGGSRVVEAVGRLTRLKFEVIDDESPTTAPAAVAKGAAAERSQGARRSVNSVLSSLVQSQRSTIEPRGAHPLLEGVHSVQVISDLPASRWRATPMDRSAVLQIGQIAGKADPAIWLRRQGEGQVITFAVASIFNNQLIGERDNARLLSNLIGWSVRSGGAVIFDDAHQGSVSYYDAKAFFADPRLHRSLGWIVLLWFVFVLGVQSLRTRIRDWNPIDVTAFVAMSGEFFASTLTRAAVGARLFENFFNSIRRRLGLAPDGSPVWEWLSAQASRQRRVPGSSPNELHRRRADHRIQRALYRRVPQDDWNRWRGARGAQERILCGGDHAGILQSGVSAEVRRHADARLNEFSSRRMCGRPRLASLAERGAFHDGTGQAPPKIRCLSSRIAVPCIR
jgi:hypothetical protein